MYTLVGMTAFFAYCRLVFSQESLPIHLPHPLVAIMTFLQVLQSLDSDLVAFRGYIDSIGTNFDGTENRRELKRLRSVIKRKIAESDNKLKEDKKRWVCNLYENVYKSLSPLLPTLLWHGFCTCISTRSQ